MRKTSEEIVALYIHERLPGSKCSSETENGKTVHKIELDGKVLVTTDEKGAKFFFPFDGRPTLNWSEIMEGGPEDVADSILCDLKEAGFETLH